MKRVFKIARCVMYAVEAPDICLVFRKKEGSGALIVKRVLAKYGMLRKDRVIRLRLNGRLGAVITPRPGITKPQLRKDMDRRVFRSAIADSNLDQNIFGCGLAILDEHVEVTLLVEGVCIDQLELRILFAPPPVLFD